MTTVPLMLSLLWTLAARDAAATPVWTVVPAPDPGVASGKIAAGEGSTDEQPHKFVVERLQVTQPVTIALIARNRGDDLKLKLAKYTLDTPDREGSTQADGYISFRVRTEGDLHFSITGPPNVPYQYFVWVGDPVQPPVDPVLLPPAEYHRVARNDSAPAAQNASATGNLVVRPALWLIAALLGVIAALLGGLLLKRRSS